MSEEISDSGLTDEAFDLAFEAAAGVVDPLGDTDDTVAEPTAKVLDVEEPEVVAPIAEDPPVVEEPEVVAPVVEEPDVVAPVVEPVVVAPVAVEPVVDPAIAQAKADEEAAAVTALAEAAAREELTEEEAAAIADTNANFPEVAAAIAAQTRVLKAKYENQLAAQRTELTAEVTTQIAPALSAAQEAAKSTHQAAILKEHPDAFTLVPDVEKWIEDQPSFMKTAYNAVLDKGSATDIVDLFNVFKKENGSAQAPDTSAEDTAAAKAAEKDKQKRLDAQEGVRGRHTGGRAAVDPDDFDGAFEKFAATA